MSWSAFHLIAAAMLTLLVLLVSLPLLGRSGSTRATSNIALIKQRLAELNQEAEAGLISPTELRQARDELKLALVDEQSNLAEAPSRRLRRLSVVVLVAAPIAVIMTGVYVYQNVSQLPALRAQQAAIDALPELSARLGQARQSAFSNEDIQTLISAIRARLYQQPEDARGWMFVGRLQLSLGSMTEATAALARAYELDDTPSITLNYVQSLLASQQHSDLLRATKVLTDQLANEPQNIQYLLLLADARIKLGQGTAAGQVLSRVSNALPESSPLQQELATRIAQLQPATPKNQPGAANATTIAVTITLAPELARPVWLDEAQLIVFARAADRANQMPAAVVKVPVSEFPMQVTLSDTDAMVPGNELSQLSAVTLTARLSADQDVATAAGELEGSVELTIEPGGSVSQAIQINKEL